MRKIFISHTRDSSRFARKLAESLRDLGDDAFLAEQDVTPGDNFKESLREKLRSADYLVALFTKRAVESPWLWVEIGAAEVLDKRVLPILLADLDIESLGYPVRDQLMLDARKLKPRQTAERIRELVDKIA